MKTFNIPEFYRSSVIGKIKEVRKKQDPKKKNFSPTLLDFGAVRFYIARHFGFCYGVENAIEISYRAIEENPDKRIYLLSQMIHNPEVNNDLLSRGVSFLMDTEGNQLIGWDTLTANDIVIIPAFGATIAIEEELRKRGIEPQRYNTTCPFVERVWKKSEKLGEDKYSIVIHGKHNHEETRATFSRSELNAPSIVIKDIKEAYLLGDVILGKISRETFFELFANRCSEGFDPNVDLDRLGVINQTTMLATETAQIADYFKQIMIQKYGEQNIKEHFADTRDTLCYATNENQDSTYELLKQNADFAIVVGGYNSSNTSHIVELCEEKLQTYFITSAKQLISSSQINHFNYHTQKYITTENYLQLNSHTPVSIILTSGASCPDSVIEEVLLKLLSFFEAKKTVEGVLLELEG